MIQRCISITNNKTITTLRRRHTNDSTGRCGRGPVDRRRVELVLDVVEVDRICGRKTD